MKSKSAKFLCVEICVASLAFVSLSRAGDVKLQNATATFSQSIPFLCYPNQMIDGIETSEPNSSAGWAIDPMTETSNAPITPQTAVFQTVNNIGGSHGGTLTFTIIQNANGGSYSTLLGRFRLSVTSSDRSTFADGSPTNGNVKADWVFLQPLSFSSRNGADCVVQSDYSLLLTNRPPPLTDTYTVMASTTMTNITGIRLETLADPSLPFGGPGAYALNGNFSITEFKVDFVEAPAAK